MLMGMTAPSPASEFSFQSGGPFVPTPQSVVNLMLLVAAVEYRGTVDGDHMQGKALLNGKSVSWKARRIAR